MADDGGLDVERSLAGKAALITGGGSGIGLECAKRLLADGCAVTIMGRSGDRLRDAALTLEDFAPTRALVRTVAGDAKSEDDVSAAVRISTEATGGLNFAVASAGRGGLGPIITTPLEEWTDIVATNLTGTFLLFKHAGAAIASTGGGAMVAISSIAAAVTHPFMGPYCVLKAGVDMLVRQTADELGRAGVRVNAVRPGIVATDLVSMVMDDEQVMGSYLENMPVSRAGEVEDVGSVVRFLLGPESSWVTGTSLSVDGGHHLRRGPDFEPAARAFFGDDAVEGRAPTEGS